MKVLNEFYSPNGVGVRIEHVQTGGVDIRFADTFDRTITAHFTTEQIVDLAYKTLQEVIGGSTTETVEALGAYLQELRDAEGADDQDALWADDEYPVGA